MGTNHLTTEQISICAEHMATESLQELPLEFRLHLKNCNECAHEVLMVTEVLKDFEDTKTEIIAFADKKKPTKKQWFAFAASIAIIFSGAYYLLTVLRIPADLTANQINDTINVSIKKNTSAEKPDIKIEEPIATISSKELPTENKKPEISKSTQKTKPEAELLAYVANEQLEKLTERYKTGALRGEDIEITTPIEVTGKPGEIKLEWSNESKQPLILEFFNNNGDKIFEIETTQSNYLPNKLKTRGLFYWKLINQDFDLLYCGKIIIE